MHQKIMVHNKFWEIVKRFNFLMNTAIEGPNCIEKCHGDCCSIMIDVPKILAKEYINRGYARPSDFIRSDVFSFKLRFDDKKAKCFLYDKNINGCLVHNSGIKPPQCWIYPTNFSSQKNITVNCKRAKGWKITDPAKSKEAGVLLKYYIFLCQLEAKKERKNIRKRISNSLIENHLKKLLQNSAPSQISGFKDTWDHIATLSAEGFSLQVKKFCSLEKNCSFLECKSICDEVSNEIINYLRNTLPEFVKEKGSDINGDYPFIELFSLVNKRKYIYN